MLSFILGISITINVICFISLYIFLRYKEYIDHKGEDDMLNHIFENLENE